MNSGQERTRGSQTNLNGCGGCTGTYGLKGRQATRRQGSDPLVGYVWDYPASRHPGYIVGPGQSDRAISRGDGL
jgi:hypothetical protein